MDFGADLTLADGAVLGILGGPVRYLPVVGAATDLRGVFDERLRRADASLPGVASVGPAVFIRLADLPAAPATDDRVLVGSKTYRIREVQQDGQGGATLHLLLVPEALP